MKKHLFVILMASLVLAACQNDKAPPAKASAEPAAASVTNNLVSAPAPEQAQKMAAVATGNAVAVTKPAKSNAGLSMQAVLHQAGAEAKANAEAMIAKSATAEKLVVAKQAETKQIEMKQAKAPVVKMKEAVANKIAKTVAKAAPVHQPAIVAKAAAKPAPKAAPKAVISSPSVIPAVPVAMSGDAARGKSLARKCKTCHNFTAKKKVGPGLKGIFERKAGIMPGMRYSPALAAGGWVWNEKNLALWVCNSKKAVKTLSGNAGAKTKMSTQRICDAGKQADLIAFLKTL